MTIEHEIADAEQNLLTRSVELRNELIGIVPFTDDGLPVIPGMYVYYASGIEDRPVISRRVHRVSGDMWYDASGGVPYEIDKGGTPYFSTKEAALKRHAQALEEKAHKARALCEL